MSRMSRMTLRLCLRRARVIRVVAEAQRLKGEGFHSPKVWLG
jgi:hypothetical protein